MTDEPTKKHSEADFLQGLLLFLKKVWKIFGGFRKSPYLCTRKSEMRSPSAELLIQGGSVAQLNRASDYGSEGCGFESRRNHTKKTEQNGILLGLFLLFSNSPPELGGGWVG